MALEQAPRLELVHLSPTADSKLRWADGSLKGMKTFVWDSRLGEVRSPLYTVAWSSAKHTAENFVAGTEVRNEGGIHAIWPPRGLDDEASFEEWLEYVPRDRKAFMALVSGWGRTVMGDVGWRAEHARIVTVVVAPKHAPSKLRQWCKENNVKWSNL